MEGATATIDLTGLVAVGALVVAVIAMLSGIWFRLGQLSNRVDELARRFDQHVEENANTRDELRQEMRELRDDLRQEMREMREENRRNHQQLLQALAHHSHDPDTGFAIFRIPPGSENPAT